MSSDKPAQRLVSLDAFRGATIAGMILVNNSGGRDTFPTLLHSEWNGWTFTDTIFPTFLWIAGLSMTLSFARRVSRGDDKTKLLLHVFQRAAIIFLIGLALNGFPKYDFSTIRIPGVLQRIAVCYLIGGAIFLYTSVRGQVIAMLTCLASYWIMMTTIPVPGFGPGVLTKEGNFSGYIDGILLPGHLYSHTKTWDPEGFISTIPAIATILLGVLAGHVLRRYKDEITRVGWTFFGGALLLVAGTIMDWSMPINKQIWTSSYAVFMAGLSTVAFACFYWIVDVQGYQRWAKPLVIYGSNAIVVYVFSGLFARFLTMTGIRHPLYDDFFSMIGPPRISSLMFAIFNVIVCYLVAWIMWRKKWFVKF